LERGVTQARREVPVPGEGTLHREVASLEEDVRSFVRMVRQRGADWISLELAFGRGDEEPVVIELEGGPVRIRGAIDRVDEDLEGVRVIDYKTGRAIGYGSDSGAFDGGRRLQHAIYALAAEARLDGRVVAGEYHFPTRRGMNQHFRYDREVLTRVEALLDGMLEGVAAGTFVPTESADDCSFCDFADVCRARRGDWGKVSSPLAEWSEEVMNTGLHPAFATLRRTRRFEQ
jgi:ATP-dependent helicase/nuclease subunit B